MFEKGGTESHVYRFTNTVMGPMSDNRYCFKANGLASVIMHKRKAPSMFKIASERVMKMA